MIEILLRRSYKQIVSVGTSSIIILPSTSAKRKRALIKDDFPAPVRPTTPILQQIKVLNFLVTNPLTQ